jgi:putative transposase
MQLDTGAFLDVIEIVPHVDGEPGSKVLPRRRGGERTCRRLTRSRCHVRDFEQRLDVSQAITHGAM